MRMSRMIRSGARAPEGPWGIRPVAGRGETGHNRRLCRGLPVTPSEVTLARRHTAGRDRLRHPGRLLPLRPRHRVGAQALHEDERGLLPLRALDPGLDRGPRLPLREPRGAGDDRHGRLRRQVRHRHRPLLLGGRHPRHGVRRHLHDALLLRLEGALGARVPEAPLRREDPRLQRDLLRHHDRVLLRHLDVRARQAPRAAPRLGLQLLALGLGDHRPRLHLPGRPDLGDLQRGAAVLPDRARLRAPRVPGPARRGRLGGPHREAQHGGHRERLRRRARGASPGAT